MSSAENPHETTQAGAHEGGLSVREQIERYRTAFIAVVSMIAIAVLVSGYILSHQNLKLAGWVPVLGHDYYTLKGDFQTAQAVTPGQGQAVTIAGAKIGEIKSVSLHDGVATVIMRIEPKYARIYRNATMLLRPKTQLQDITVEVNPGTPSAGKLKSGGTIPLAQTAPNVDFDEFLAGLDGETRAYLQELVAAAGEGLDHNGRALSAALKRLDPAARDGQEIAKQLQVRNGNIARSIHNFRLLTEALGGKDQQLSQLVDASNAVFATFRQEDANFERALHLLPGALRKTGAGLGKLGTATDQLGPALRKLQPFASALAPSNEATRRLAEKTTPIFEKEIRPFARQILPVTNELQPATQKLGEAFPNLKVSFTVLNEFFNELAYNPGASKPGFLFFVPWGAHNLNSVVSSADAHGPLGRSLVYFNCKILPLLKGASEVNKNVNLLIGLLKPPAGAECATLGAKATASSERNVGAGVFSGLSSEDPFGGNASTTSSAKAGKH
jgi:phospholipid/cholesterol/gamma-HCH transport system substrate-binding protein